MTRSESGLGAAFVGAKLTVLSRGHVLTLLRDDTPAISYPNMWDLPGGGREGAETPLDCVLRETHEEFGLVVPPTLLTYRRYYPYPGGTGGWHFGAVWDDLTADMIRFGDEGQGWQFMPAAQFVTHENAVPFLQERTRLFLDVLATG